VTLVALRTLDKCATQRTFHPRNLTHCRPKNSGRWSQIWLTLAIPFPLTCWEYSLFSRTKI